MLLNIETLLLILAALGEDHRAAAVEKKFPLDMAPNSVDDQYEGCKETFKKDLEMLKEEMRDFNSDYQEAKEKAMKPEDNLKEIHSIAIYAYTNMASEVYMLFNAAVRSDKQIYMEGKFKWFSLYFLLTDAIHILRKTQTKCYSTYRGTKRIFDTDLILNKEVRLGSFSSSSLNSKVAVEFGSKSCFEIYTCEGADIIKYSKYPKQEEVLIPPYETFKVVDVKNRADHKDLWCDTVYILKHFRKLSYMNCPGSKVVQDSAKL